MSRNVSRTRIPAERGKQLFQRLRLQLTLWYSGVLAGALLLFGTGLYFGAQYMLFTPLHDDLAQQANMIQRVWQRSPSRVCLPITGISPGTTSLFPPTVRGDFPFMMACYDAGGLLVQGDNFGRTLPASFLDTTLVTTSLHTSSSVSDVIDGGGSYGHIYRYALPIRDQTGNILGVIQIGISVATQEKALDILLSLLLVLGTVTLLGTSLGGLLLANRALIPARLAFTRQQRFIADASHELRTPLTLLSADAEVLLQSRERLDPEDAALLDDIFTETSHMSTLATNMLTLARLDSSDYYEHREHDIIHLDTLAANVAHRFKALADQQHISISIEAQPSAILIGDHTLLEQALLILLDNAIKYNIPGGSVTLRTFTRENYTCLEVRDTGPGIASKHLAHLGERFYRVDKARTRATGGTGLGLSIAHSIARTHNGTLTLTSVLGQGTSATLSLPTATPRPKTHVTRDT